MRITEDNLIYFTSFLAEFKNRKEAFGEFQKLENEGVFTSKNEDFRVENSPKIIERNLPSRN
jgi:hypothetical protein